MKASKKRQGKKAAYLPNLGKDAVGIYNDIQIGVSRGQINGGI
jgi:hypothetical protein